MAIEYQKWTPIDGMPERLLDASVSHDGSGTSVLLVPFGDHARALRVRFSHVLAYAVYDDFTFALGDIKYGLPGVPSFIVRNYDWPAPHMRYEASGFIAMLIGDKTGPTIIAHTYGDVRPEHLLKQAQRIRLTATAARPDPSDVSSIKSSNTVPEVSAGITVAPDIAPLVH